MVLRTEKNFKILAILFLIIPLILITVSFITNCFDEDECEQPIRYLGPKLAQNIASISGIYLATSLVGILIGIVSTIWMITNHELSSSGITIIGIIPWLSIILINMYTKKFSKWRILYGWVIITQLSYIVYWIHPYPLSPV